MRREVTMGEIRRILVHVGEGELARGPLRAAAAIAAAHGAEVAALQAVEPMSAAFLTPEVSAVAVTLSEQAAAERRLRAGALLREACPGATLLGPSPHADPAAALVAEARGADLLVVSQPDPQRPDGTRPGFAGRVLVESSCPVLFVPHVDWSGALAAPRAGFGERVLVAWSDTRESARALRDALPLLARAKHVALVGFVHATDGEDALAEAGGPMRAAVAHLRRHGVTAEGTLRPSREPSLGERLRRAWIPDASVGEALLSHAADIDADLVVMGGFGHARAWELVLGGVTRTLLQTMTVPVLMSH
jgi:nucleotide-binding universal stress UspA family protein